MAPAVILLYHRISNETRDAWCLNVTPAHFEEHLRVIHDRFRVMSLADLVAANQASMLPRRCVAVTFDDGYADNSTVAGPLLQRYGVPATVFVAVDAVESGRCFWWDALESLFLDAGDLPEFVELELGHQRHKWLLGPAARYGDAEALAHETWRVGAPPPSMRHVTLVATASVMRRLDVDELREACRSLEEWTSRRLPKPASRRPMTLAELDELAELDMVHIGAHTVHHPSLPILGPVAQAREIRESRVWLERRLERPIRFFSYPYGHFDERTLETVRADGVEAACTVVEKAVGPGQPPLELPRVGIEDWEAGEFERRLELLFARS